MLKWEQSSVWINFGAAEAAKDGKLGQNLTNEWLFLF